MVKEDVIDRLVAQWNVERPDLDVSVTHVLQRITRVYLLQAASFAQVFGRYGLTMGEWEVLAALRRNGPPYCMRPTDLYGALVLSSGALTNRLDRLEEAGLVERLADPDDRRGRLIRLTEKGRRVLDQSQLAHLANEERLLSALSAPERAQLTRLLRKLLVSEPFRQLDPAHAADGEPARPARGRRIRRR